MKKIILLFVLIFVAICSSIAQGIELTPFAGYTLADKFPIQGGEVRIGGGFNYGGTLTFTANEQIALAFTYSRVDAPGSAHSVYLEEDKNGPVSTNYFFIGASRLFPLSDEVVLYAGLDLGGAFLLAPNTDYKSATTFAGGVNAGIKYFFNERIGLRGQASLNFPVTNMDTSYWWDPSNGNNTGTTSNVPLLQFGFTAGLIYKIFW